MEIDLIVSFWELKIAIYLIFFFSWSCRCIWVEGCWQCAYRRKWRRWIQGPCPLYNVWEGSKQTYLGWARQSDRLFRCCCPAQCFSASLSKCSMFVTCHQNTTDSKDKSFSPLRTHNCLVSTEMCIYFLKFNTSFHKNFEYPK